MQKGGMRSILWLNVVITVGFVQCMGGCGTGMPDPPAAKSSTAASSADDPDAFRPAKPRSATPAPPPPPTAAKINESAKKQPAPSDPDAYVPVKPRTLPAAQPKNNQLEQKAADANKSDKSSASPTPPSVPPKINESAESDPDAYVPAKPNSPPKTVQPVPVEQKSDNESSGRVGISWMDSFSVLVGQKSGNESNTNTKRDTIILNLDSQLQTYQREKTDNATRAAMEKQFISDSRESLRLFLGFNTPPSASTPRSSDWPYSVGTQLWDSPFINFLDLQHRAMTTLSERPSAVALATLIPNNEMRVDLQRTLSRHWSEGPKTIRTLNANDYPLAEPGFIAVLKSLIRDNRVKTPPPSRSAASARLNSASDQNADTPSKLSSEEDWNKLLEELMRDYCRRIYLESLNNLVSADRNGASSSAESHKTDSPIALLPGCEISAAYSFNWPGVHVAHLPNMTGQNLSLVYQRIEKRMKASKPLTYYRRQVKSCIERPLPNGLWLDGLTDLKKEDRLRSIDVLITHAKTGSSVSVNEEQELTVEILVVEIDKLNE